MSRIPVPARWCALVAVLNAFAWSFVVPPFHVPDETGHLVYVQYLAEKGEVPDNPGAPVFSPEEAVLLDALGFNSVAGRTRDRVVLTRLADAQVDAAHDRGASRVGGGGEVSSSAQPPLFYVLEAGVYRASPWTDLLSRMWLMRAFSCLLAGVTTLFAFLFLRELLREPWMWTTGALAVAFQPVFAFISSGLNPDALLFASSAALLFGLARAFRRGLDPRIGVAIGLALAVGTLAKLNFIALVPGAVLGLALLVLRAPRGDCRRALLGGGLALAVLAAAVLAYAGLNTVVWDRPALGGGVEGAAAVARGEASRANPVPPAAESRAAQLSYTWQLYLPRLSFMNSQFDYFPPWQTWFKGFVGLFGWLDTPFPEWVYKFALLLTIPLTVLLGRSLIQGRAALWRRWPELVCYGAIAFGLMVSIGILGLRYVNDTGFRFEQARYLLPLLPLYGAAIALAARGAGRRLERQVAALLLVLLVGHGLFAQMLVISRFYG